MNLNPCGLDITGPLLRAGSAFSRVRLQTGPDARLGNPPGRLPFLVLVPVLTGLNLAIEPNSSALALEPL
jgi:hypothetical protein